MGWVGIMVGAENAVVSKLTAVSFHVELPAQKKRRVLLQ